MLVRHVRGLEGTVRLVSDLDARPDFARAPADWAEQDGGWREGVSGVGYLPSAPPRLEGGSMVCEVDVVVGEERTWALVHQHDDRGCRCTDDARAMVDETVAAWRSWSGVDGYDGPARAEVTRSAMVLRALSFDETGALLAAATTSLPEDPGGVRNWDYRFTWHRDASLHVLAMYALGHGALGRRYGSFLVDRCVRDVQRLRPLAGPRGEQAGEEVELQHLAGYAGSSPVRDGNEAFEQVLHDSFGHVLDAAFVYRLLAGELSDDHWEVLWNVVDTAARSWHEPDHGLWEVRGPQRHYVNSKVLVRVCLDRGVRIAEELGADDPALERWREAWQAVRDEVLERGTDPARGGAFVMAYDLPELDASLLRIPLVGFLPGDDERVLATIDAVAEELGVGPALVHRYDTERVDDGLPGSEGAFLLSSFEMVSALAHAGRLDEAQARFDRLLAHQGPLGLWSEQMAADGTALGNYPQAFTHVALIEAAITLRQAADGATLAAVVVPRPRGRVTAPWIAEVPARGGPAGHVPVSRPAGRLTGTHHPVTGRPDAARR